MSMQGFDLYSNFIYLGSMGLGLLICLADQHGFVRSSGKHHRGFWCAAAALPFSIVLGLRSWKVGYDTYVYIYHMYGHLEGFSEREYVFAAVVRLLHWLTDGGFYPVMLLAFSFAAVFLALYAADAVSISCNLPVFYAGYCLLSGLCLTDQFRQLLGCSLFLLALAMYNNKKRFAFVAACLAGTGIHNTILIAFLIYWLCSLAADGKEREVLVWYRRHSIMVTLGWRKALLLALAVTGAVFFYVDRRFLQFVVQFVPESYMQYFTSRLDYQKIGFGLLLDSMIVIPSLFLSRYTQTKQEKTMRLFGFFIPVFRVLGYVSYFLYRLLYYPQIVLLAFYAVIFSKTDVPGYWKWATAGIALVFYAVNYMYMNNHGAFPYQFYFE